MKKKSCSLLFVLILSLNLKAQYISEIIEYTPAPGQFINTPYGNQAAAQSITGTTTGIVSLGAFGGYIIFKFQNPVENNIDNPFGIDFVIFGNPASELSAEPGIVSVMKDENANGLPDEIWYELAGSDYFFSSAVHNYEITYTNPGQSSAADVPWTDNVGESGYIFANDYHTQTYYPLPENFPNINQVNYTLSGTKITANIDCSDAANIHSYQRVFGYADNRLRGDINSQLPDNPYTNETENMGGDSFDISWAVDENGNYVYLNEIDFIKVTCGVNANLGWLGELSTEISGAVDILPDNSVVGTEDVIVIKDLPATIYTGTQYPLEAFLFNKGQLQTGADILFSCNLPGTSVDENNILTATQTGSLIVTATLVSNPNISTSINVTVSEPGYIENGSPNIFVPYPNPALNLFGIKNANSVNIEISDGFGNIFKKIKGYSENKQIDISTLPSGIYFVKISDKNTVCIKKIIKN